MAQIAKSLKELIEERKKERAKLESIENSNSKLDLSQIEETDNLVSELKFSWDAEAYPSVTYVAEQIERMGFELKLISEETGFHIWATGSWSVSIHQDFPVVTLNYRKESGEIYSELSISTENNSAEEIVLQIAKKYFSFSDEEDLKTIKKDREAWNKKYSNKLGVW